MVSQRLLSVPASPIRKLVPLAEKAKKEGVKIYHLNIGDPDIRTPAAMLQVLRSWRTNPIRYGHSPGEPEFLAALKTYYHRLGFSFIEIPHLQVTSGGSEAISMAMFAVTSPAEEILTPEPLYANYNGYAAINGVRLVPIPTSIEDGFHLPPKKVIEKVITPKTRAILICNPNNPTGTVYTKEEIETLVALAKEKGLFLLADEVYREYVYDGRKHISILSYMRQIPKQAILLDSVSKRYSLCGLRLGALVSLNSDVMAGVLRIAQGRLSAGFVDQQVAAKLTEVPPKYYRSVHEEYNRRRRVLYEGLKKIPGVVVPKPEGAFYIIAGLPVVDAEHFCQWLLTDFRDKGETVMLAPAAGFYASTSLGTGASTGLSTGASTEFSTGATPGRGKNEVRIAYVLNEKALRRCVELLAQALKEYRKQ